MYGDAPTCRSRIPAANNPDAISLSCRENFPTQPDLFSADTTIKRRLTLAERYLQWRETDHGKEVFHLALAESIGAYQSGFEHYSIDLITSVIRHRHNLAHKPDDGSFNLNNSFRPLLARELMEADERLRGFFETRKQKLRHKTPLESTPNRARRQAV